MQIKALWHDVYRTFVGSTLAWVIVLVNIAIAIGLHFYGETAYATQIIGLQALVNVAFLLILTRQVLRDAAAVHPVTHHGERGVGSLFLLNLISGLGILAGLVLLVLPGMFLILRWSVAVPILVARHENAMESLRQSWDITADNFGAILSAFMPIFTGYAAWAVSQYFFVGGLIRLGADILFETMSIISWILACCIFLHLRTDDSAIFT